MTIIKVTSLALFACSAGWLLSSCSHLDTSPPGADRVLTGTVTSRAVVELPPNAEVTVRIVDLSLGVSRPDVLAEQTISGPTTMPVPFRIEYRADDAQLMRSVAVEARISIDGRLRYITKTAHPLTLSNVNDPHSIDVEPAGKH